jgi:hypothetical protein
MAMMISDTAMRRLDGVFVPLSFPATSTGSTAVSFSVLCSDVAVISSNL